MQSLLIAFTILALGSGAASAQTGSVAAPSPADTRVSAASGEAGAKPSAHAAAIADCESMWDRGTHMTKAVWSRACRRVQDRLQRLELR